MDSKRIRKNRVIWKYVRLYRVDYEQILGVKAIYDMHRYLMTKHNISL